MHTDTIKLQKIEMRFYIKNERCFCIIYEQTAETLL